MGNPYNSGYSGMYPGGSYMGGYQNNSFQMQNMNNPNNPQGPNPNESNLMSDILNCFRILHS